MAEKIAFENRRICNLQGLVTLTFDRVILHTIVHHSSTSTYMPNFIEIEGTFCGWMDRRTDGRHLRPTLLYRLWILSRPKNSVVELTTPECFVYLCQQPASTSERISPNEPYLVFPDITTVPLFTSIKQSSSPKVISALLWSMVYFHDSPPIIFLN